MKTIPIENSIDLTTQLESLKRRGYIFRGQPNAKFSLAPNAFRKDRREQLANKFHVSRREIEHKWFTDSGILDSAKGWMPDASLDLLQRTARPLLDLLIFLMQYNYFLHRYFEDHPERRSPLEISLIELRHSKDYWGMKENFISLFSNYYPSLWRLITEDGVVQHQPIIEDLTGIDETHPQHYDIPTAALDWSYNPYVAMYFALQNPARHFSIYAYKNFDRPNCPISIKRKNDHIYNVRAERQEGTFTYFNYPCSFFLTHGNFPSIEDYDNELEFNLIKFNIPSTPLIINVLNDVLQNQSPKITEAYLFPDKYY